MSGSLMQQKAKISNLFENFSSDSSAELRSIIENIQFTNEEDFKSFRSFLEKQAKKALKQIMASSNLSIVAQLISLFCDQAHRAHKRQAAGLERSQGVCVFQNSLAIVLLEDVLEFLGVNDLKQILPTISEKICAFKQLTQMDQNRLLRLINHLLKRISKTQDYLIRGELQFALTKILPLCHDSGFHSKNLPAKGIKVVEEEQTKDLDRFGTSGITFQFYKDFWNLQKYLLDPNQLIQISGIEEGAPQKPRNQSLLLYRLKNMEKTLGQLVAYMNTHPANQLSTPLNQPIKFLTNSHLLQLQLNDSYFRQIILCQVLIFCLTLKNPNTKGNLLKGILFTEAQKQQLARIQLVAQRFLDKINQSCTLNFSQVKNTEVNILQSMKSFFENQIEWVELKDHWKERKKTFFRSEVNQKEEKVSVDYAKKISQVKTRIANQMQIEADNLRDFLVSPCTPHIVDEPTLTSVTYYWQQGKSCLNRFDFQKCQQQEFSTKSEYNMFEWKAFRSLYRQNIKDRCFGDINPKLKQHRLLSIIQNKQKQIKRMSGNQDQNKVPSPPKQGTCNNRQAENQQIAKNLQNSENRKEVEQNQEKSNERFNQQNESPKKKIKTQ